MTRYRAPWRTRTGAEEEIDRLRVELAEARRLAGLSEHSPHAMVVHCDGVIRWANQQAADLVGIANPAESYGRSLYDFIDPSSADRTSERIGRLLADGGVLASAEAFLRTPGGDTIVVETRAARVVWDGRPAVQVVIWDVTKRYEFNAMLEWEASHDPLTGIWNRRAVLRYLEGLLVVSDPREIAVALVDLDGFKGVNDSLGHPMGDRVLVHVADRLRSISDCDSVGRLGGDEFLVVCPDGAAAAVALAGRIGAELHLSQIDDMEIPSAVTATVGVAYANRAEATVERLLSAADADLYAKRRTGRRSPTGSST